MIPKQILTEIIEEIEKDGLRVVEVSISEKREIAFVTRNYKEVFIFHKELSYKDTVYSIGNTWMYIGNRFSLKRKLDRLLDEQKRSAKMEYLLTK